LRRALRRLKLDDMEFMRVVNGASWKVSGRMKTIAMDYG
jgi:hypothetical protein